MRYFLLSGQNFSGYRYSMTCDRFSALHDNSFCNNFRIVKHQGKQNKMKQCLGKIMVGTQVVLVERQFDLK